MMGGLLEAAALMATALVAGGIACLTAVVAPAAFAALEKAEVTRLMSHLFPRYYAYLGVTAAIAAIAAVPASMAAAVVMALVAAGFAAARWFLLPGIERARPERDAGNPEAAATFRRLHGVSVALNLVQLIAAAWALLLLAGV